MSIRYAESDEDVRAMVELEVFCGSRRELWFDLPFFLEPRVW
jgi:hypothetical protein